MKKSYVKGLNAAVTTESKRSKDSGYVPRQNKKLSIDEKIKLLEDYQVVILKEMINLQKAVIALNQKIIVL